MTSPNERPDLPPVPASPSEPSAAPEAGSMPEMAETSTTAPMAGTPATPTAGAELKAAMEGGARALDERAQALGREAEAAVTRLGENPAVRETADLAGRIWGLVVLAFGLWFFADITLKLDLPAVAWGDLWPLILIVIGAFVVLRGVARRS